MNLPESAVISEQPVAEGGRELVPPSFNKMKTIQNIIIANDTEAFSGIIQAIKDLKKRAEKIAKENFLCGRFILWEGDNKIVITPKPIQKEILEQVIFLGQKSVENWFPKKITTDLSRAIYEDSTLFAKLKMAIQKNPGVTISPYCYTFEFSKLLERLYKSGLKFRSDQCPVDGASTLVSYLGSKTGFRNELRKIAGNSSLIPQPEYFIHTDIKSVFKSVESFYERDKSCVVKANSGEGGWGVLIVRHQKYSGKQGLRTWLRREFSRDSIWRKAPYIVEEFINSDNSSEHSPSLEVFISKGGHTITYICNQVVDEYGRFMGILMGKNCIKKGVERKIRKIGSVIGKRYAQLGYRGFFDIDFTVSTTGEPYPIETNVRRTGGTHVYDFVRFTFGSTWSKKIVVFSSDSFNYRGQVISAEKILLKISAIRFPMNNRKEGVIIVALSDSTPIFSFILVGASRKRVFEIYSELKKIFSH